MDGDIWVMIVGNVLIETYWNVKFFFSRFAQPLRTVLIETYWNVKVRAAVDFLDMDAVLIETYWNVKKVTADLKAASAKY